MKPQTNTNPHEKSIKMRTLSNSSNRTEGEKSQLGKNKPHKCHHQAILVKKWSTNQKKFGEISN